MQPTGTVNITVGDGNWHTIGTANAIAHLTGLYVLETSAIAWGAPAAHVSYCMFWVGGPVGELLPFMSGASASSTSYTITGRIVLAMNAAMLPISSRCQRTRTRSRSGT